MTYTTRAKPGEIELIICEALMEDPYLSNGELSAITGKHKSTISEKTKMLVATGVLKEAGVGYTANRTKFSYYSLVKAPDRPATTVAKKEPQMAYDTRKIKRSECSVNEVPYPMWWEGGGLYAGLADQKAKLAA